MNPTDKSVVHQIIKLESTIKEQNKTSEANLKALANAKAQRASQPKLSWLGRLVNFLRHSPKLHKLHEKLLSVSSKYRDETKVQKYLDRKLKKIIAKHSQIKAEIQTNETVIKTLLKKSSAVDFIAPLFGGKDQFDQLPVIRLPKNCTPENLLNKILPNQMKEHPVVQLQDESGRLGFAVRSKTEDDTILPKIQVFRQIDNTSWETYGDSILFIDFNNYVFIKSGKMSQKDEENYAALRELITTGKANVKYKMFGEDYGSYGEREIFLDRRDPTKPAEEPIKVRGTDSPPKAQAEMVVDSNVQSRLSENDKDQSLPAEEVLASPIPPSPSPFAFAPITTEDNTLSNVQSSWQTLSEYCPGVDEIRNRPVIDLKPDMIQGDKIVIQPDHMGDNNIVQFYDNNKRLGFALKIEDSYKNISVQTFYQTSNGSWTTTANQENHFPLKNTFIQHGIPPSQDVVEALEQLDEIFKDNAGAEVRTDNPYDTTWLRLVDMPIEKRDNRYLAATDDRPIEVSERSQVDVSNIEPTANESRDPNMKAFEDLLPNELLNYMYASTELDLGPVKENGKIIIEPEQMQGKDVIRFYDEENRLGFALKIVDSNGIVSVQTFYQPSLGNWATAANKKNDFFLEGTFIENGKVVVQYNEADIDQYNVADIVADIDQYKVAVIYNKFDDLIGWGYNVSKQFKSSNWIRLPEPLKTSIRHDEDD